MINTHMFKLQNCVSHTYLQDRNILKGRNNSEFCDFNVMSYVFLSRNQYYEIPNVIPHRSCRTEPAGDSVIFRKRPSNAGRSKSRTTN